MSVSTTTNKIIYTGSGTTGPFDYDFRIYTSSDLIVEKYTIASGVTETLTETTDYSVSIDGDGTGTVTLVASISSSYKLVIRRVLPVTQEIDYVEGDKFPAETHEEGLDRSRMIDQQLQEQIDRCIKVSVGSTEITADELLEDINNAVVAAQLAETNAEAAQAAAEAAAASIPLDAISGDGTVNPTNLLNNGDFESWSAGASAAPDGWTLSGAGASVAREGTIKFLGSYSAKLTRAGATATLYNDTFITPKGIAYWKGKKVTLSKLVYATVANRARIRVYDNVTGFTYSSYHSGNSTWELLTVTATISATATSAQVDCVVDTGDTSAYFDGAMLVEGESAFAFSPKPAEEGVWADYGATSTLTGWASTTGRIVYTKRVGKFLFVYYYISGTSNAVSADFTVPYAAKNDHYFKPAYIVDNGTAADTGYGYIAAASNSVVVEKSAPTPNFTNSGTKTITGQFFFEVA